MIEGNKIIDDYIMKHSNNDSEDDYENLEEYIKVQNLEKINPGMLWCHDTYINKKYNAVFIFDKSRRNDYPLDFTKISLPSSAKYKIN